MIQLAKSEISRFLAGRSWGALPSREQQNIAASVLRGRGDANSNRIAFLLETRNPNLTHFQIIENL